ncbi:MAG: hypothetical protein QOF89_2063 [Acidobacteriota bacterium]|jgi:5-methylcytosine-specific restriction endonuclease McrA|nr:hypothetical protein [Acidobacteriota bacterium]
MESLLSSPARLNNKSAIESLKRVFSASGVDAAGVGVPYYEVSEIDRFQALPLVFGLIPARALTRKSASEPIKPYIREHLTLLGVEPDEDLVSIVKYVADQYYRSGLRSRKLGVRQKAGISDLKAMDYLLYRQILHSQNGRCSICGVVFDGSTQETLDHKLPYRLVGDIPGGSNWQLLCIDCNRGKSSWFGTLQSRFAYNWVYDQGDNVDGPNEETRFVVFAQRRACEEEGCGIGPKHARLTIHKVTPTGLAVSDNLRVLCEEHGL